MKRTLLLIVFLQFIFNLSAAPEVHLKSTAYSSAAAITDGFITEWETTEDNQEILIPIQSQYAEDYNYDVDWGDGHSSLNQSGDATHVYATKGVYQVTITGDFPAIDFGSGNSDGINFGLIKSVVQWGNGTWKGMDESFLNCYNLTSVPNDNGPDFAPNSTLYGMFKGCIQLNCDLDKWDLTNVRETSYMFYGCVAFNGDVSSWNVAGVTNMEFMFKGATTFNGDISTWNVSNVTRMNSMFEEDSSFNSDISGWDVSHVQFIDRLFLSATAFNQDIGSWDISSAGDLTDLFKGAAAFNQNLGDWDLSSVTKMDGMLSNSGLSATNYEATLKGWAAASVPSGMTVGVDGLHYCQMSDRSELETSDGWTFMGDRNVCLVPAVPDNMGIVYVDSSITVPGDGSSWNSALRYLSNATVSASTNMDITAIHIAKGTYFPTGDPQSSDKDSTFYIKRSNLKLLGGYPTGGGQRNIAANKTILSGNLGDPNSSDDNASDILIITKVPRNDSLIVDGLTLKDVYCAQGAAIDDGNAGAAITISGCYANTVVRHCRLVNNTSDNASAMLIFGYDELTNIGELILDSLPNPQVLHCLFENNLVIPTLGGGYTGTSGTLAIAAAAPYIDHCDFVGNKGYYAVGSFSIFYAHPKFNHCIFTDNQASLLPVAVNLMGSVSTYVNCLMKNNIITGSSDQADPFGIGTLYNNAIIGNLQFGGTRLINCTIANNTSEINSSLQNPLIFNVQESASFITNSIITGNTSNSIVDQMNNTASSKLAYSLIEGMAADPSNHMLDGTLSQPIFVDTASGNFQLKSGSAAIDAGLNDSLNLALTDYLNVVAGGGLDLAGNQRILNGVVDLGAYEINDGSLPVKSSDLHGQIKASGHAVLSWITYTETNNSGFYIQRSSDGIHFTNQGFVATQAINGTGQSTLHYHYDAGLLNGAKYFRFVQVDQSGTKTTSNIVRLAVNDVHFKLLAYPNPVRSRLHLKIQTEKAVDGQLTLMNYAGKVFRKVHLTSADSYMDLQGLAAGVYILHFKDAQHTVTLKVVKQ